MPALLAGLLLALSAVGLATDYATIYTIRRDMSSIEQAHKLLQDARVRAGDELYEARRRSDPVAEARAQKMLETIQQVERRANLAALARQVQQADESFRESNWREFLLWAANMGAATGLPRFENAWGANGFILDTVTFQGPRARTAQQGLATAEKGIRAGPLPSEIGQYLLQSTWTRIKQANPQLGSLSQFEQKRFLCEQTRRRLGQLVQNEQDAGRMEILRVAQADLELQCRSKWVLDGDKGVGPNSVAAVAEDGGRVSFTQHLASQDKLSDMTLTVQFHPPPAELEPGTEVTLTASGTFKGFISPAVAGPAGGPFEWRASGVTLKGDTQLLLPKKQASGDQYSAEGKLTPTFMVPEVRGGHITITGFLWNCPDCYVTWVYKPE